MEDSVINTESINGIYFACGAIMFVAGCLIIRILHALDDNDRDE